MNFNDDAFDEVANRFVRVHLNGEYEPREPEDPSIALKFELDGKDGLIACEPE